MSDSEGVVVSRRRGRGEGQRRPAVRAKRVAGRCARYQGAASRAGPAIVCSVVLSALVAVAVLRNEHSNEFQKGSYVVSLGYHSPSSCSLHGMTPRPGGKKRVVDVVVVEPGLTDPTLLRLRYDELDAAVDTLVILARGPSDPAAGSSDPWVWATSGAPAAAGDDAAPPSMRGPEWASLLSDFAHKLTVVLVPDPAAQRAEQSAAASTASSAAAANAAPVTRAGVTADRSGAFHGDDTLVRSLLRAGGREALEAVGADRSTLLILGRAHEIPRAGAVELMQSCQPAQAGMCLATATYALSFEFRKPKAFRHSPLVLRAGDLVRQAPAGGAGGAWSGLDLGSFRGEGLPCLTDAGWTCEHCTTDWSMLEPAAVTSLRSWLGAGRARRASAAGAYRAMYEAYCAGEDPLGASPVRGLDVQVTAVGLPRHVRDGKQRYAHLLPGRCEGGEGAERLWSLLPGGESPAPRDPAARAQAASDA